MGETILELRLNLSMTTLPERFLGDSGLKVSRLGLGLAALGRPGYINLGHADDLGQSYAVAEMEAHAHGVLEHAYARGVRYFDAARSYGRAEAFLASWLGKRQPQNVVIGSKWGYTYTADWQVKAEQHEVKEHSLERLNEQWPQSYGLLGKRLKLYQVHSVTPESSLERNWPLLERLDELKAKHGVLIGLTLSGERQARVLHKTTGIFVYRKGGGRLFDTVQATYNLLEPSVGPMLETAHENGMGVIVKEALANGRLTERNPDEAQRRVLKMQAERLGTTVDALALAFVLREPWADVVLSGAATLKQLSSNLEALEVVLDEEALAALASLRETPEVYWNKRSGLEWN